MRKPPSHSMYGNKKCIAAKIFHPSMASKKVSFLLKRGKSCTGIKNRLSIMTGDHYYQHNIYCCVAI